MKTANKNTSVAKHFQPRLIRLRDAPHYLGMDKNRFNREVRPGLMEISIGKQGIAFDRFDLDAWVEQYKRCNGRPTSDKGVNLWDVSERQDYENVMASGTLKNKCLDTKFTKVLAQATSKKPS